MWNFLCEFAYYIISCSLFILTHNLPSSFKDSEKIKRLKEAVKAQTDYTIAVSILDSNWQSLQLCIKYLRLIHIISVAKSNFENIKSLPSVIYLFIF